MRVQSIAEASVQRRQIAIKKDCVAFPPSLQKFERSSGPTPHILTRAKKYFSSDGIQMAGRKERSGGTRAGAVRKNNPEKEGAEYSASTEGLTPLNALEVFMNDLESSS